MSPVHLVGESGDVVYVGQIINGFSGAWAGPGLPLLRDLEQSPLPYLLTESQLSFVASLTYLGAIPGTHITAWLSNTRGRKPCLVIGGFVSVLSYVFLATANNLAMLYISRFLAGVTIGIVNVMNLVYIGEIASPKIRGILLTAIGIFTTVGMLMIFAVGPYLSYNDIIYVGIILAIAYLFLLIWIPESPIFYAIQGRNEDVNKVLQDLGRTEDFTLGLYFYLDKIGHPVVDKIKWLPLVVLILFYIGFDSGFGIIPNALVGEMFTPNVRSKGSTVALTTSYLCGFGITTAFGALLEIIGGHVAFWFFSGTCACAFLFTAFFIPETKGKTLLDIQAAFAGRKLLLLISTAICSLTMFTLGLYFYLDRIGNPVVDIINWLPLVVLILFYIGYDSGFGIIPNALIGEMFTPNVRSKGSTVALTTSYLCGFGVTTAFGALLEIIGGHIAFWFFSVKCACAFLFTAFFIPETKGKTLMDIQDDL
ncbi:facilitated trehalose transporter Tret1 [Bicyclus anynana]|uniref:Facilitated trehalose transporter Tret1 n=1 Tax=Bicyclus anynana TaxID=110368 RepID=A0ABM3M0I6_BICAN|nr:facilitated trehalose transporter Tret1 [Bicyclus anynana]